MAQIIPVGDSSGERRATVIFIHGLGGDPHRTWQHGPSDELFWPRWLLNDITGLSVYSVGYEASFSRWRGAALDLVDRANNVLRRILAETALQSGPLILIGHSFGGLLIKQILKIAEDEDRTDFLNRIEKVVFIATPHTGSDLATLGIWLRILLKPSAAVTCVVRNDGNLRYLNNWYRKWSNHQGISHLTLIETHATWIFGMVVKPDNGDAGLESVPVPVVSNHHTICKPMNRSHDTYVFVKNFIATPKNRVEEAVAALNSKVERLVTALTERGVTDAETANAARAEMGRLTSRLAGHSIKSGAGDKSDDRKSRSGHGETSRPVTDELMRPDPGLKQNLAKPDPAFAAAQIQRMIALKYPDDRIARFAAMREQQGELYTTGSDEGLNLDLRISIEAARLLRESARGPHESATALNDLGVALATLGERESGTARLEQAVDAYRGALSQHKQQGMMLEWARTQNNLGVALQTLGERGGNSAQLEQAVDAYRAALQQYDKEQMPLDWARTQNNLGNALQLLGEQDSGPARLEEAVEACRAALEGYNRKHNPLQWATTQNNLGAALHALGERESGTERLEEALHAYRAALLERTRERVPLDWATTQNNLGALLHALGERENDPARIEVAVGIYREALLEQTRERASLQWAATQNNLGTALFALGKREEGIARLEQALDAYREALRERTRYRVPLQWATTQNNLGNTFYALGEREGGKARLEQAVDAYREALLERTRERAPYLHDLTQQNLAIALEALEWRKSDGAT